MPGAVAFHCGLFTSFLLRRIGRMMKNSSLMLLALFGFLGAILSMSSTGRTEEKLKVLLIDGQNNHAWQETTPVLVKILADSGRFDVTVSTTPSGPARPPRLGKNPTEAQKEKFSQAMKAWEAEEAERKKESKAAWEAWRPNFSQYDVVVSNYNGELWPEEVRTSFDKYVRNGGGFVSVHAANNSFGDWKAYNEMIAVGGWGGRSELSGPYLRLRGGSWTTDPTAGKGGSHGQRHNFLIEVQDESHPITKGLPSKWMHAEDELYDRLRGPAENVKVLAAAYSAEETGGSGEYEPMLMVIDYGKGRVFHTTLGHNTDSMSGVGFQETLKRGTEWAASGKVTFPPVGADRLPAEQAAIRDVAAQ